MHKYVRPASASLRLGWAREGVLPPCGLQWISCWTSYGPRPCIALVIQTTAGFLKGIQTLSATIKAGVESVKVSR